MKFHTTYSQGLNMSTDDVMGTRIARESDSRNVSSESKRKRGGEPVETGDVLRKAIQYDNEQLNCIAD